jgi:hypothetical protein
MGATTIIGVALCCMVFPAAPDNAWAESPVQPTCAEGCPLVHVYGIPHESMTGSVATPIGTTYSVHHLLGADLDQDGSVDCRFIYDPALPGAPDDIVTYDGMPEPLRTDLVGTVPTVTESKTDNGDGTHLLILDTSAPPGGDLFPGGIVDQGTGTELTDACFLIGVDDFLDWDGVDVVTSATISFLSDGSVVAGPLDVSGPDYFSVPWNGLFGMTAEDLAGTGVDGVHMEILVGKEAQTPTAACCVEGTCIGDVEEASCAFQGGRWHPDASCGADPALPPPVCNPSPYLFHNGFPLDDYGAPISQYAPDARFSAAAVDDFMIPADDGSAFVRLTSVWAWVSHNLPGIDPSTDYEGVTVTVYTNRDPKGPAGIPENDGSHTPVLLRGVRYSQTIPMASIAVTSSGVSCIQDTWKLDIPVDILLTKGIKYWLEVQPIMPAARGYVHWQYAQNNNDHRAQRIGSFFGIFNWTEVPGNDDGCPGETPPAGTHRNLAFQLFGVDLADPPNDDCAAGSPVTDGFLTFSTIGATTDGPEMPEDPPECQDFNYSQLGSDIWFEYDASCSGDMTVSLCGSQYDTKIAVYDDCGSCPPRVDPVACNEDYCNVQSQLTYPVVAGQCYRIRVGGYVAAQGHGLMTISCYQPPPPTGACCDRGDCLGTMAEEECLAAGGDWYPGQTCATIVCPVPPPPNDECHNCIPVLTGNTYPGTTDGASGTDLSSCGFADKRDVWYCWTPDCTGSAVIGLCDSDNVFDTSLTVYEACGGRELACSDNYCGPQSLKSLISPNQLPPVDVWVTEGETYYIRIAGRNGSVGDFNLSIDGCANACCSTTGFCMLFTSDECSSLGGMPQGDGTTCLGDQNGNTIDDACEGCPLATIADAVPPDGVVDARQPYEPGIVLPRQGIGSAGEPVVITLDPPVAGAESCFVLCETAADDLLGPNRIDNVTDLGSGAYEIALARAITVGAVTTIQYIGDGSYVAYTSHPANVDADSQAAPPDILRTIDYLNGVTPSPWGMYSEDIDHSGVPGPPDILRVIDLLNGAGEFDSWINTALPVPGSCPG